DFSDIDAAIGARAPATGLLLEDDAAPVRTDAGEKRPVEPREVPLALAPTSAGHDLATTVLYADEHPAIAGAVVQSEAARRRQDCALLPRQREGEQIAHASSALGGRPHLLAPRCPGQSADAGPAARFGDALTAKIEDHESSAVVAPKLVLQERDAIPPGRHAKVADPVMGLMNRRPQRCFDDVTVARVADDGELLGVHPVRILDLLAQLAHRAAEELRPGHRPGVHPSDDEATTQADGQPTDACG